MFLSSYIKGGTYSSKLAYEKIRGYRLKGGAFFQLIKSYYLLAVIDSCLGSGKMYFLLQ